MASNQVGSSLPGPSPKPGWRQVLDTLQRFDQHNADTHAREQMLAEVLDELLDVLACDQAWLAHRAASGERRWTVISAGPHHGKDTLPPPSPTALHAMYCQCAAANAAQILPAESEYRALASDHYLAATFQADTAAPCLIVLSGRQSTRPFNDDDTALLTLVIRHIENAIAYRNLRQQFQQSQTGLQLAINNTPSAVLLINRHDGRIVEANKHASALLNRPRASLLSTTFEALGAAPDGLHTKNVTAPLQHAISNSTDTPFDWTFWDDADCRIPCQVRLVAHSENANLIWASLTNTSRQNKPQSLTHQLSQALQQTADAVMITDNRGIIEYVNPAFESVTGHSPRDVVGKTPAVLNSGKQSTEYYQHLWQTIQSGEVFSDVLVNRRKDRTLYYEEKTITPLKNAQGEITHFISTSRDITERLNTQERLHYLANHDVLTDLPNRTLFMDRLQQAATRADRHQLRVAVIVIDLDRFKMIIDTLGHDVSDRALKTVAQRLVNSLRAGDTVARLGGDEFAVIAEEIACIEEAERITRKLLQAIAQPVLIDGHELYLSASTGISFYPDDGDAPNLTKHADTAMWRAKEQGHNRIQFYSADMSTRALERLSLETGLRRALDNDEFCLHYQPQFDLNQGRIVGVEALLRWHHPHRGLMQPTEFVPILEETDLIIPVGEWVLATVCKQLEKWQQLGIAPPRMAVNLSSRQLSLSQLEHSLHGLIQQHKIDCSLLELEITESLLLTQRRHAVKTLQRLSDMGIRLCIDDFGTGYSSLSYLKQLPVDALKIDRSFIRDVNTDKGDAAIVRAIIAMARSLRLTVVAEGVETEEQLQFLKQEQCDITQGFYFSSPLEETQLDMLINQAPTQHSPGSHLKTPVTSGDN